MSNNVPGGKGSSPRPYSVNREKFAENWDRIFQKKQNEFTGVLKNDNKEEELKKSVDKVKKM